MRDKAPPILFTKGNTKLFKHPSVGFCGSRKASIKGIDVTEKCAAMLAEKQICVTSGYAAGVDLAAHSEVIKRGGTTIIVLVEGILRFSKKQQVRDLLTDTNFLVVSQFPPNLTWIGRNAMKRNSTIIGLSDAMILVESGVSGGTFAAGNETLKLNRPLFVIDFAHPGPSAEANKHFIEKGGVPIRGDRNRRPNLDKLFAKITEKYNIPSANLIQTEKVCAHNSTTIQRLLF